MTDEARDIVAILQSERRTFANELAVQDWIAERLSHCGIVHNREYLLDAERKWGWRIDFMVLWGGSSPLRRIGIEVKVKGSRSDIVRQLFEYAPYVDELILASTRIQHGYDLPDTLDRGRVPVTFAYLGGAF